MKKHFRVLVTYSNNTAPTQRQIIIEIEAIDALEAGHIAWEACDDPSHRVIATQVL